jgi:hypothetical protein
VPVPTSRKQFRLLQAAASGGADIAPELSAAEAREGLREFAGSGKKVSDLPLRKRKRRARRPNRKR